MSALKIEGSNLAVIQKQGYRRWIRRGQAFYGRIVDCGPETRRRHRGWRLYCYVRRISDAYAAHQCALMACACAYCALLSVVPLLVVGIAAVGFLMGSPEYALDSVLKIVGGYTPSQAFISNVRDILEHIFHDRQLIGLFGLIGLLYAAHQTFLAMQPAFNLVWVVPETRHWLRQRGVALAATLYTILLLGADLAASGIFVYLERQDESLFTNHAALLAMRFGVALIPMLVITLLSALLYRYLPSRKVPWQPALIGASVTAVFWQALKIGFGIVLVHFNTYNRLYGSLGSLVIVVVWAYYSMAVLLLGAEVAADYETMRRSDREAEERAHSGADLAAARGMPLSGTAAGE